MACSDKTWLAIINPHAGVPLSRGRCQMLVARLKHELHAPVFITQTTAQVANLVAQAHDCTALAIFGGDGTIAEIVNQMDLTRQSLLPICGGTGNGLARDLGLTSLNKSLIACHSNQRHAIDVLNITFRTQGNTISRLAVSTVALGDIVEIVVTAKRFFRRLGAIRYVLAMLLHTLRAARFGIAMQVDGIPQPTQSVSTILVNNTRHAGNFSVFRQASLSDGQMDILLRNGSMAVQTLSQLAILKKPNIGTTLEWRARTLALSIDRPLKLMIDGDIWHNVTDVYFEILPNRLTCFGLSESQKH
jgi:diacylglycerol kinase family enzyme